MLPDENEIDMAPNTAVAADGSAAAEQQGRYCRQTIGKSNG